nr:hypothetical protein B0A51_08630 [Rachicladosporium sp. CCFEE 5018]
MAVTTRSGKKASAEDGAAPGTAAQASSQSVLKKSKKSKSPPEPADAANVVVEAVQSANGTTTSIAQGTTGEPAPETSTNKPQSIGKVGGKRPLEGESGEESKPKKGKTTQEPPARNHCKELDATLQHLRTTPLLGNAIVKTDDTTDISAVLRAITSVTEAINRLPAGPVFSLMNTGAVEPELRQYGAITQVVHPQLEAIFPLMFVSGNRAHLAVAVLRNADGSTSQATACLYDSRPKSRLAVEAHQSTPEHAFVRQAGREIMDGGWKTTNTTNIDLSIFVSPAPADQTNSRSCGIHAILNGWAVAMGLDPSRGCVVNPKFYEDAVLLINAAVYGAATACDIEDFFRCKKFVLDTPVPEGRVFENTVPMWDADTVNDLVARIATAQLEQEEMQKTLTAGTEQEQPPVSKSGSSGQPETGSTGVSLGDLTEEEQMIAAIALSLEEQGAKSTAGPVSEETVHALLESTGDDVNQQNPDENGPSADSAAQGSSESAAVDAGTTDTLVNEELAQPSAVDDSIRAGSAETTISFAELFREDSTTQTAASTHGVAATITAEPATESVSAPSIDTAVTAIASSADQPLTSPELEVLIRDFSPFPSPPSASTDLDLREEPTQPQPPVPEINVTSAEAVTTAQPIANPELVSPRDTGTSAARWAPFLTPPRSSEGSDEGRSGADWGDLIRLEMRRRNDRGSDDWAQGGSGRVGA